VRRNGLAVGGFPFEFANDSYPDVDDTAVVVLALRRAGHDPTDAAGRGLDWMLGMQSRSGGFGAFDVDNESSLCARLAFCDFGAVTDPPSADVTAHVLETLAYERRADERPAVRALGWLLDQQERDGSWFGRWGANYVYGTGSVLPALAACGLAGHESVGAAVRWLERVQNPGGGFGEDLRSYRDPSWSGRGASTASQTAWALIGLHAAGESGGDAAQRAVQWLVETQQRDGGWDEPYFTGTGFPGDFYLNYHLYRDVFPVMALGRILGAGE
jgi:squalene-hopene/tetraprenyl-beta-curcumene cyclase